jgi:hypothetical protein
MGHSQFDPIRDTESRVDQLCPRRRRIVTANSIRFGILKAGGELIHQRPQAKSQPIRSDSAL